MVTSKNEITCPYCIEQIPAINLVCPICDEDLSKATQIKDTCNSCAKEIPEFSKFCPFCGSPTDSYNFSPDQVNSLLTEHIQKIEANKPNANSKIKKFTAGSIALISITLFLLLIFISFLFDKPIDIDAVQGVGFILFLFICFTFIYYFFDKQAREMQTIKNPIKFYKTFFKCLKDHRNYFAYNAVSPMGKTSKETRLLPFTIIDKDSKKYDISILKGFKKYWRSTLIGAGNYHRIIKIKSISLINEMENISILEINFKLQSYDITFSIGKKNEAITIRKTLIKHNDKWYVAEGEFQGIMDFITFEERV